MKCALPLPLLLLLLQVELADPDKMAAREKKFGKPLTAGAATALCPLRNN
jgi:hypothetical protein